MLRAAFRKSSALQRGLICLVSAMLVAQPVFAWSGEGIYPAGNLGSEFGGAASVSSIGLPSTASEGAAEGGGQPLQIDILDGEGALNNIRARTAREPIVQVTDKNHKPVAGALVVFAIQPGSKSGALHHASSASFNGAKTLRVHTDASGRAIAHGLTPNKQAGSFAIQVTAVAGGVTATAVIHQQNVVGPGVNGSTSHPFLGPHTNLLTWIGAGTVAAATTVITVIVVNRKSSTNITTSTGTVGVP